MRINPKFAALTMLTATAAFAGGSNHYWDPGHRSYTPWKASFCKLQLEEIYQPMGGSQPIHLKVRNVSHDRLQYRLSLRVNGQASGSFFVDNANPNEVSDRDADRRYPGTLTDSRITVTVESCSIRS